MESTLSNVKNFIFKASQLDTSLLGVVNYNGYGPPDGFCFDQFCNDQPIMDDKRLEGYNLEQKA